MADSGIRLRSNIGNTSVITYNTTSDIPDGKMVGCAKESNLSSKAYGMLGKPNDSFASRFRVVKNATIYSILEKRKVIEFTSNYPSYSYIPMDADGYYDPGYQYKSYRSVDMSSSPTKTTEVSYVKFPCPGTYRVNFQADRIAHVVSGRVECFGSYAETSVNPESNNEVGYAYRAFYGLRLTTANGKRKWIAVPHDKPSREFVNDIFTFSISAEEFGNGSAMPVHLYLCSRTGHNWSEYGTVCRNPFVQFDFG